MSTRLEKDRAKAQQEKFQAILAALLKDEDNKYCEDCDAKGPRWASWNLGVFLCIRCAGIHRNLGVHISRVKSVNLDSWTAEQVAMMQEMGNSRARAVYEANVPDSFRRPQTDSALEAFVRAKYEQKKYIAREWVPPKPVVPKEWLEDERAEKKKARGNKPASSLTLTSAAPSSQASAQTAAPPPEARVSAAASTPPEPKPQPQPPKPKSGSDDLLGLDAVPQSQTNSGGQSGDLLADIFGESQAAPAATGTGGQQNLMGAQQNGTAETNLFETGGGNSQGEPKSAKDSIMALYGSGGGQQQMFGVPGYSVSPMYVVTSPVKKKAQETLVPERTPLVPATTAVWGNSAFNMYQRATEYCSPYYASTNPFFYTATGGMYMPQQQMYGGGMAPNPMMQQQQGMMGQPMQQGMMGMQQQPAMYGGMGQMAPQQMAPQQMAGGMMGGNQAAMMGRPGMGGQMFMQQPGAQQPAMGQQMNMQQMPQMQFQQMQQQMASMKLGGGQMGGMQQQPPTAVAGGGTWAGASAGQTLSTNLWQ